MLQFAMVCVGQTRESPGSGVMMQKCSYSTLDSLQTLLYNFKMCGCGEFSATSSDVLQQKLSRWIFISSCLWCIHLTLFVRSSNASYCGGSVLTLSEDDQGSYIGIPCLMLQSVFVDNLPVSRAQSQSILASHSRWSEGLGRFSLFVWFFQ